MHWKPHSIGFFFPFGARCAAAIFISFAGRLRQTELFELYERRASPRKGGGWALQPHNRQRNDDRRHGLARLPILRLCAYFRPKRVCRL